MTASTRVGPLLQIFFTDHLVAQRRLSLQTVASYRDTIRLLLQFVHRESGIEPAALEIRELDAEIIFRFLDALEKDRGNAIVSRNLRLTAIRSFYRMVALRDPESVGIATRVLAIPLKRANTQVRQYVTREERAAKRWAHRWYRNASSRGPEQTDKEFRQTTCNWLRFAGRLRDSDRMTPPHQQEIDALCRNMDVERELSPATIATQRHYLKQFFKYTKKELGKITIVDVERFLVFLGKEGWTRAGIRGIAHYLRRFFRYREQMGWTKPGIADAIHDPRVYQHEQLPLGPSWADVQRLLASAETNRKADIRDRPILLLLAFDRASLKPITQLLPSFILIKAKQARTLALHNTMQALASEMAE
jgi:site-specific recombinase XerD